MNKPTLTKEQAEAIEKTDYSIVSHKEDIVTDFVHNDIAKCLMSLSLDEFIRALYIGYTVEQTPEEKVRKILAEYKEVTRAGETWDEYELNQVVWDVATNILNSLNIQIEGVNK